MPATRKELSTVRGGEASEGGVETLLLSLFDIHHVPNNRDTTRVADDGRSKLLDRRSHMHWYRRGRAFSEMLPLLQLLLTKRLDVLRLRTRMLMNISRRRC